MLSKTRCLVRVGVGKSDGRHEANPSFSCNHQNFETSRNLGDAHDGQKQKHQGSPVPQFHIEGVVRRLE